MNKPITQPTIPISTLIDTTPMKTTHTTWMILKKGNQILLGYKKRGFGQGNLNGVGGKLKFNDNFEIVDSHVNILPQPPANQ